MKRRVVVTGLGAVSPLGLTIHETWQNLLEGKSGIDRIRIFDASEFPTKIAGEVKGFDFDRWMKNDPALNHATRSTFFALQAAEEAFKDSNLRFFNIDPQRFGI